MVSRRMFALGLLCAGCAAPPVATDAQVPPMAQRAEAKPNAFLQQALEPLRWLLGTWASQPGTLPRGGEDWSSAPDGTLLGRSYQCAGTDGQLTELDLKHVQWDGEHVVLLATVDERQPPLEFVLEVLREQSAEFTNPDNDFPKAIRYVRQGETLRTRQTGDGDALDERWSRLPDGGLAGHCLLGQPQRC